MQNKNNVPKKKEISLLMSVLLFLISILLLNITAPIGIIFGIIQSANNSIKKGFSDFLLQIALTIDQLGNVIMQHLFNEILITKNGYKFGNKKETISSVLGKNQKAGTLSNAGKKLNDLLDTIDPHHSLDSIDYHTEE